MPVLVTSELRGVDAAGYDQIAAALGPVMRAARGFRAHAAEVTAEGVTVTEIWADAGTFRAFFDAHVAGNLPPGASPQVHDLHAVLTSAS